MGKNLFVILFAMALPINLFAYIPQFWMIMSRTAENHGRGIFRIYQDVIFNHNESPMMVQEEWIIKDGHKLRVNVTGKKQLKGKIRFSIVYSSNKKYQINEQGVKVSSKLTKDWFEPFFHFRYSKRIKEQMVNLNMIPAAGLLKKKSIHLLKDGTHTPENFVRLARVGGDIAYGVGTPTAANTDDKLPGLWVQQDEFNVLKLRMPTQVEVVASQYTNYGKKLKFPKLREVRWGDHIATIRLTRVKSYGQSKKMAEKLSMRDLNFGKNPKLARLAPNDPVIAEFYSRFR